MAAQERDDAEPTEGAAGEPEPAAEAGADESAPDQLDTARVEPEPPDAEQTEPAPPPPVGPGGTSILPPVPGGPPPAPEQPRWAARAQVPTPRVEEYGDEWMTEPPRRLLVPVLLTVCVMLLLAVIGVGVWLALSDNGPPVPSPTATTATATPTAPVTTTNSSPPPPTSSAPAGISIPDVSGQEYEVAAQTLAGLGLEPERADVFSETVPTGQVIGTSPPEGSTMAPGETIRVFVSLGPEPTETATPTETPSPTETDDEGD